MCCSVRQNSFFRFKELVTPEARKQANFTSSKKNLSIADTKLYYCEDSIGWSGYATQL